MLMRKMPGWGEKTVEKDCYSPCGCGCAKCSCSPAQGNCDDATCSGVPAGDE